MATAEAHRRSGLAATGEHYEGWSLAGEPCRLSGHKVRDFSELKTSGRARKLAFVKLAVLFLCLESSSSTQKLPKPEDLPRSPPGLSILVLAIAQCSAPCGCQHHLPQGEILRHFLFSGTEAEFMPKFVALDPDLVKEIPVPIAVEDELALTGGHQ
jgi:hypothetical protein